MDKENQSPSHYIDISTLKSEYEGAENVLEKLITELFKDLPEYLDSIKSGIQNCDYDKLKSDAHTFKGILTYLFSERGVSLLGSIETLAENKNGDQLNQMFDEVKQFGIDLTTELKLNFPEFT